MKKKISLILFLMVSILAIAEVQKPKALIVRLSEGTENAYILSEEPIVTIQEDKMIVTGIIEVVYFRSEISKFYFDDIDPDDPRIMKSPTGVDSAEKGNVEFRYVDGENILIRGLNENTIVTVTSIDGVFISSQRSDSTGNVSISLKNRKSGVYVISFEGRSIKVKI